MLKQKKKNPKKQTKKKKTKKQMRLSGRGDILNVPLLEETAERVKNIGLLSPGFFSLHPVIPLAKDI